MAKKKRKLKVKLKKRHVEYILKSYKKRKVRQMAEHISENMDLKITELQLRNVMREMGLVKNRPWTQEEDDWLIESNGDTPPRVQAKELFRTINAIYDRLSFLGLKVVDKTWMITTPEVVKRTGINRPTLYKACKEGLIEGAIQTKVKHGIYVFEEEGLHNWLVKHHTYSKSKCWHCDKVVIGSLYCKYHMPNWIKLKPVSPVSALINSDNETVIIDEIVKYIKETRMALGMSQLKLANKSGLSVMTINSIEKKIVKKIDLATCFKIMKALGVSMSFRLNVNGQVNDGE